MNGLLYEFHLRWSTRWFDRYLLLVVALDALFTLLIVVEEGRRNTDQEPPARYIAALASWALALVLLAGPASLRAILDAIP